MEVTNRFKGLHLKDRLPEELRTDLCITEVKSPRQKMTHFKVYKVQPPPESKLLLLPEEKPGTSHALSRPLQNLESTSCLYGFTRSGHLVETELYSVWPFVSGWVRKIPWRRDRLPTPYSWASLVAQLVRVGHD